MVQIIPLFDSAYSLFTLSSNKKLYDWLKYNYLLGTRDELNALHANTKSQYSHGKEGEGKVAQGQ